MTFWLLISGMAVVVAALLGLGMLRGRRDSEPAAAYDLRVYRQQLAGVDKDLARGVIAEADAERIRTEISRRILAADAQIAREADGPRSSRPATLVMAVLLGAVLIGGALVLYRGLGAPGYGDLPLSLRLELAESARRDRPDQATAEARLPPAPQLSPDPAYLRLIEQLRDTVAARPDDAQGHDLLALHEANLGNFDAARAAKQTAIDLKGESAGADDFAGLAEILIAAAGGYVSPEAEAHLKQALQRDASNGMAQFFWGLMQDQTGRPDLAFRIWERALQQGPETAPWIPAIRAQIEPLARRAGVDYAPPAAPRGPSAADMAAAADMSAEERAEMVRGMVEGLSDRLATEGGPPEDWARLIGALGVLGERDRAQAILEEARGRFSETPGADALLDAAARQAGIEP